MKKPLEVRVLVDASGKTEERGGGCRRASSSKEDRTRIRAEEQGPPQPSPSAG